MDAYLAIVSGEGGRDRLVARLVDYYPSFETGLRSEWVVSGRKFHLRLSTANYCSMPVKDFVVERIVDQDALKTVREASKDDSLPCFIVHES